MSTEESVKILLSKIEQKRPNSNEADLFSEGILDSLSVARLIANIENEFNFQFDVDDILPENFSTVKDISTLIDRYLEK